LFSVWETVSRGGNWADGSGVYTDLMDKRGKERNREWKGEERVFNWVQT
jgi:hypothetical protein